MTELKGKNQIRRFKQVAEKLVKRISPLEGVAGIVYIGGLTRGFADKYSDVDIIVFLGKKDEELKERIRKIGPEEERQSGLDIDLEIHCLADFKKWKLDEIDIWDFSKAEIVFDPHGETGTLLKTKLHVPKNFWLKKLAAYAEYIKWYCCPPKEDIGTIAEMWVERGDLLSAHYCINYAIDLALGILYALNDEFMPAQKWRLYYSYKLRWLPADYKKLMEEAATVKSLSMQDLSRRIKALRKLWNEIVPKVEKQTRLTMDALHEYYVKTELHQT
jgi:predicted nucleotidyltransferase